MKVPGYADFREILARDDIDAGVLAVPDHRHASMAVRAPGAPVRASAEVDGGPGLA